jgi:transposase
MPNDDEGIKQVEASFICRLRARSSALAGRTARLLRRTNHDGDAEGVINKVKLIRRRIYGLPTFHGFRERVFLACA